MKDEKTEMTRRAALVKLGLATTAVYAAPTLLTLSDSAEARQHDSSERTNRRRRRSKSSPRSRSESDFRRSDRTNRRRRNRKPKAICCDNVIEIGNTDFN